MRKHLTKSTAIVAALLASTSLAIAQEGEGPAPGNQMTEDATVPTDRATHYAVIGDEDATAWFRADPQNNTLEWTVEFADVNATSVGIACGMDHEMDGDDAMAGDEAPAGEEAMAGDEAPAGEEAMAGDEAPAGEEAMAGDEAGMDVETDDDMMATAIELGDGQSPVQGDAADIDQETFDAIMGGACEVVIEIEDGEPMTGHIVAVEAAG